MAATGLLHLLLAPEYLSSQAYIGVGFIVGAAISAWVAIRLWNTEDTLAWSIGALTAAGMFAGFVLSRTTGLPGFHEAEWELSGLVSLVLEAGVVGTWFAFRRHAVAGSAAEVRSAA